MLLALAALIVVGIGGYCWVRSGPQLVVVAQRVHDVDPLMPAPRLVLVMILANESNDPIEIIAQPALHVRSVNTGGEQAVRPDRQAGFAVRVPPRGSVELVYDLWQLTNLYLQGFFRDVRDSPQDMRFRFEVETDAGLFRSDEWANVTAGSDFGELLREMNGGVAL